MKAVSMYSPYGWKAKIGLIVPSTNTINEPEFWRMAPPGVTIHTDRVMLLGKATEKSYFEMADALSQASDRLATAEVDVIAYGCTSGSIICPLPELLDQMGSRTKTPATAAAGGVVAGLRALGAKNIAVGTPYVTFVNESEKRFLEEDYGFNVVSMHGMQLGETQEERRGIGRVPPQQVYRLAQMIDRPEADALFISCTNLASLDVIEDIERDLGKPVVISNQACFWSCLRLLGLPTPVEGYGRLMRECLDPITMDAFKPGMKRLIA
ncbi:decarboxylase [Agaricicola taiwanensis]|uniref:Decarboxylase n=1 Tax=Agaricicola taiwanensis TaxID=591372 RepID=A0A8J2YN35_9RHOB|nr:aspartate/glutamate racemase family protein [Agaricicola taiwanensis]GGE53814.1 decarboxylase [Agaricicola taiwanensis]